MRLVKIYPGWQPPMLCLPSSFHKHLNEQCATQQANMLAFYEIAWQVQERLLDLQSKIGNCLACSKFV